MHALLGKNLWICLITSTLRIIYLPEINMSECQFPFSGDEKILLYIFPPMMTYEEKTVTPILEWWFLCRVSLKYSCEVTGESQEAKLMKNHYMHMKFSISIVSSNSKGRTSALLRIFLSVENSFYFSKWLKHFGRETIIWIFKRWVKYAYIHLSTHQKGDTSNWYRISLFFLLCPPLQTAWRHVCLWHQWTGHKWTSAA